MGAGTVVNHTPCLHGLSEESVVQRWEQVERQIMSVLEDDRDAQVSALQWCGCCCGPSKGEFCTRCQEITPEQYQRLMGIEIGEAA